MGTDHYSVSPDPLQRAAPELPASNSGLQRKQDVARFVDTLCMVLSDKTHDHLPARQLVRHMCDVLGERDGAAGVQPARSLPVCTHLGPALAQVRGSGPGLSAIADHLAALAPQLHWQLRAGADSDRSPFRENHANTQIVGPNGIEQRHDVVIGASLMAAHAVYPNHQHPSREVYLVLSDGQWWSEGRDWFRPGMGGIAFHPSGVSHAMRATAAPLLALCCLWPDQASA